MSTDSNGVNVTEIPLPQTSSSQTRTTMQNNPPPSDDGVFLPQLYICRPIDKPPLSSYTSCIAEHGNGNKFNYHSNSKHGQHPTPHISNLLSTTINQPPTILLVAIDQQDMHHADLWLQCLTPTSTQQLRR